MRFMRASEIIALLMPEPKQSTEEMTEPATALLRDADGRMSLQPITSEMTFAEQVMTTGCFRRGKPIIDPMTREIMGYELEMIAAPEARQLNARLLLGV
jgi:hypothetical protein